jgi:hypothetical protein
MPATPIHHTATVEREWDGPATVAALPNDRATLHYCHAWETREAGDVKANYRFPHHASKGGPAVLAAVRNGLARLAGAQVDDKSAVAEHLRAHLEDASR